MATRRRKPPGATTRGGWGAPPPAPTRRHRPARQRRQSNLLPLPRTHSPRREMAPRPRDADRRIYLGPSHARCNLAAAHKTNCTRARATVRGAPVQVVTTPFTTTRPSARSTTTGAGTGKSTRAAASGVS